MNAPTSPIAPAIPHRRPSKVAIVGAGSVGSTLAYACVVSGVSREVVLYDIDAPRVKAEALDIAHGIQFTPMGSCEGSDDINICAGADVVVVTAGPNQKPGQTRLELANQSIGIMRKLLPALQEVAPNAIYLMVANPVDVVTYAALKITGMPTNQLFGSGTVLDTSRLRYLVAQECGVAVRSVHAYIAGEHGDSELPLWSSARIGAVPLLQWGKTAKGNYMDDAVRNRIATDVRDSAYEIIAGKGVTNYAIGVASVRIIEAILRDENSVLTVSSLLDDYLGISDVCMSVPAIVGHRGVVRTLVPVITEHERQGLENSANALKQSLRSCGF